MLGSPRQRKKITLAGIRTLVVLDSPSGSHADLGAALGGLPGVHALDLEGLVVRLVQVEGAADPDRTLDPELPRHDVVPGPVQVVADNPV